MIALDKVQLDFTEGESIGDVYSELKNRVMLLVAEQILDRPFIILPDGFSIVKRSGGFLESEYISKEFVYYSEVCIGTLLTKDTGVTFTPTEDLTT